MISGTCHLVPGGLKVDRLGEAANQAAGELRDGEGWREGAWWDQDPGKESTAAGTHWSRGILGNGLIFNKWRETGNIMATKDFRNHLVQWFAPWLCIRKPGELLNNINARAHPSLCAFKFPEEFSCTACGGEAPPYPVALF